MKLDSLLPTYDDLYCLLKYYCDYTERHDVMENPDYHITFMSSAVGYQTARVLRWMLELIDNSPNITREQLRSILFSTVEFLQNYVKSGNVEKS